MIWIEKKIHGTKNEVFLEGFVQQMGQTPQFPSFSNSDSAIFSFRGNIILVTSVTFLHFY